ncbi:MAG: HisA/HisF-related TIM barrel protein [Candidatus Omnitrophica bacterium]|nr:HisA/HisF-related TIM barrel protein [Candidatus Omnitrophota bacterium]
MLIIPAIDLKQNKTVRLHQGKFDRVSVYSINPEEAARRYLCLGIKRLHLIVLWGAKEGSISPLEQQTISRIIQLRDALSGNKCALQLGGGIRREAQISYFFSLGIDYLIVGTSFLLPLALESGFSLGDLKRFYQNGGKTLDLEKEVPEFELMERLEQSVRERIIVAVDYQGEEIALSGWEVTIPLLPEYCIETLTARGYRTFLLTNIERDGTMEGVDVDSINRIILRLSRVFPRPNILIAGGITRQEDIETLSRLSMPPQGVVVGKALYQKRLDLFQLLSRFPQE